MNAIYMDTDAHNIEIAEFYDYNEEYAFELNMKAFEENLRTFDNNGHAMWTTLTESHRTSFIMKLLDLLEMNCEETRKITARCILYIVQGCWCEILSELEQTYMARQNVVLLYRLGVFDAFVDLLNLEIENNTAIEQNTSNAPKQTEMFEIILAVLYTITEVIRNEIATNNTEFQREIIRFRGDISDNTLVIKIFDLIVRFDHNELHLPIKKIVLLLWKLLLVHLGGVQSADILMNAARESYGLPSKSTEIYSKKIYHKPKVYQKNFQEFLNKMRSKYLGYTLDNDSTTIIGLPEPICESLQVLRAHLYTPLSVKQLEMRRIPDIPAAVLYEKMYPDMESYIGSLMRVLYMLMSSQKLRKTRNDNSRRDSIVMKALTSTILLLLKHFKVSHIYHHELLAYHIIRSNCNAIFMNFLSHDMNDWLRNDYVVLEKEFPSCVLPYRFDYKTVCHSSWRHTYIILNLLRIINKLVKHKRHRAVLLANGRWSSTLKRLLLIDHPLIELYTLKLLKNQLRYYGGSWRQSNLRVITSIYNKVRLHLNDNFLKSVWIERKDQEKFWNEEEKMKKVLNKFNEQYDESESDDSSDETIELSDYFKQNYEKWLAEEVY